jgi:hypothetical protein
MSQLSMLSGAGCGVCRFGLFTFALFLAGGSVCHAVAPRPGVKAQVAPSPALPDLTGVPQPNPAPVSPAGWDVFAPPVSAGTAAAGTPTIAEWTRAGGPGDSLVLTGDKLSNATGSAAGSDTQFLVYGGTTGSDSTEAPASIERLDGLAAAISLPANLPAWSTYLIWPMNSAGYGPPIAVNRTDAWWVGPDQAPAGDTVSVYGRNLSHANGTTASWVYIKPPGAAGQWAAVTSVNPYRVQFTVPSSLAPGTYEVWVHNGHGGNYGWSGPLAFTVAPAYSWNGDTFNVQSYGALGDGATDDTNAIAAAYAAAVTESQQTGLHPTLYFPAGTYMMRYGFALTSNCRFLGDGMNLTILRCNAAWANPPAPGEGLKIGLFYGNGGTVHDVAIQGLTLDAGNNFISGGSYLLDCVWDAGSDIRVSNVGVSVLQPLVNGLEGDAYFHATTRLTVANCEFFGGGVLVLGGHGNAFDGCAFQMANGVVSAVYELVTNNLSITGCQARDFAIGQPGGTGMGRLLAGRNGFGSQGNAYLGGNTTTALGPDPAGNDGEQVLCEGDGSTLFAGAPTAATATTITFGNLNADYTGQTAVINGGKGLGQYRQITGYDAGSNAITVSPAWNVVPDATSNVLIAQATSRWVMYQNAFDGKSDYATVYTAMAGIEPYGGCYEWIADGNVFTHLRTALYVMGLQQTSPITSVDPCFFNYFANNSIQSCYQGIQAGSGFPSAAQTPGVGALGNVFRNNQVSDISTLGAAVWSNSTTTPGSPVEMTLFGQNTFSNLATGFDMDSSDQGSGIRDTILVQNAFSLGSASSTGSFGVNFGSDTQPDLQDNTWTGFATTYAGTPSGPVLEVPIRNFSLAWAAGTNAEASLTLVNAGTSALAWTAASDSAWLTLSATSGTIADQNSEGTLVLSCDPSGLQPGTYAGTITISGASQTMQVTVQFTVASPATVAPRHRNIYEVPSGMVDAAGPAGISVIRRLSE